MVARRALVAGLLTALVACGSGDESDIAVAGFVGGAVCADCHAEQAAAWTDSHHDLAMQPAEESTVLGDFDNIEFSYGEVTTRFSRRDDRYLVSTDNAAGEIAEFELAYTFGVLPLQQYLVELPDGALHALSVAWDSRPADEGGQRWFHLYPDGAIDHTDPLHWTGSYQRWDTMCADCHSTDLVKSFDPDTREFASVWSSIDVDCEACHGPGSLHAADPAVPPPALPASDHAWLFEAGERIASRSPEPDAGALYAGSEVEVCAQCHSRRAQLTDAHVPGNALLDGYRPALLEAGLYHADGQILDEVYVYASFLQSAMARAGVSCSDCHEPHSVLLRAEGNSLCAQCHLASEYDQPEHHFHQPASAAAECTACHMRAETYMVVDPRRDHSFRVPRPDLSESLDSPNACRDCHVDQSNRWAADRVAEWYPDGRWNESHFGQALSAGRNWSAEARPLLLALIDDAEQPAVARATALGLLAARLAPADVAAIGRALDVGEEIVQLAAIDASASLADEQRIDLVQRFLDHERLALRIAAARVLLPVRATLSLRRRDDLDAAIEEFLTVQAFNSDRAEGLANAAGVAVDQGRYADAEAIYLEGIAQHPEFGALYVNLSDLHRLQGRNEQGIDVLDEGVSANDADAGIRLALAFALVREGRAVEALPHFALAAELAPADPYYGYVHAIARNDAGETERALELLIAGSAEFPGYTENLYALATLLRESGRIDEAYAFAERLAALMPGDANALALLSELGQRL